MDYLIRFVQIHESFRRPETEALAELACLEIQWLFYDDESPFAIIRLNKTGDIDTSARLLIARSILSTAIYELWGCGKDLTTLHEDVRNRTQSRWPQYSKLSFRFEVDSFHGSHTADEHRELIETFKFMGFEGPIRMRTPDVQFAIFEDYELDGLEPRRLFFGRFVAESGRKAMNKYNLKKRNYIATTSMDAELSLVTANLALAAPGKVAYDPFMGTGSFPLCCAHFGAVVFGSDLDGRSIRGRGTKNVRANFGQYETDPQYLGGFVADLTNSPVREERIFDAIVCDPPYGVREGLKVLGSTRVALQQVVLLADGTPAHLQTGYVPPKKSYSFLRMTDDILDFAASRLVDGGRLCMWMPVAGETEDDAESELVEKRNAEYAIPLHPALQLVSVCKQDFSKWSRRLLTYARQSDEAVDEDHLLAYKAQRLAVAGPVEDEAKVTANDLNTFRKKYFQGFKERPENRKC